MNLVPFIQIILSKVRIVSRHRENRNKNNDDDSKMR